MGGGGGGLQTNRKIVQKGNVEKRILHSKGKRKKDVLSLVRAPVVHLHHNLVVFHQY